MAPPRLVIKANHKNGRRVTVSYCLFTQTRGSLRRYCKYFGDLFWLVG